MLSGATASASSLPGRQPNVSKTNTTRRTGKRKSGSRTDENGMTPEMWAELRAMTDEEVLAAARRDPDAKPLEDRDPARLTPGRHIARAKRIRWALRMSQADFAKIFHIPLATLRQWECHFLEPDETARAYLEVIAREPEAVRRALSAQAKEAA